MSTAIRIVSEKLLTDECNGSLHFKYSTIATNNFGDVGVHSGWLFVTIECSVPTYRWIVSLNIFSFVDRFTPAVEYSNAFDLINTITNYIKAIVLPIVIWRKCIGYINAASQTSYQYGYFIG